MDADVQEHAPPDQFHQRGPIWLITIGFALVAYGSIRGSHPAWPVPSVWIFLACIAATGQLTWLISVKRWALRIATVSSIVAAQARAVGFMLGPHPLLVLPAIGAWEIVVGALALAHTALRGRVP